MGFTVPCPPSMVMEGIEPNPILTGKGDNPDFISDGRRKKLGTMSEKLFGNDANKKKNRRKPIFCINRDRV